MTTAAPPTFWSQRRTVLRILCVPAVVIALVVSTLFLGSTSHRLRTGSVAGVLSVVRENVRLQGVALSGVTVAGTLSSVDDYWARFFVAPVAGNRSFRGETGFAQYQHHAVDGIDSYQWVIVAIGASATTGCSSGPPVVPPRVLRGFGVVCPAR